MTELGEHKTENRKKEKNVGLRDVHKYINNLMI